MKQLLELAKKKFPDDWTDADELLFRQTALGEVARYGDGDPAEAEKWGKDRILPANHIEWLCTDREAAKAVTHRGVRIEGARIDGLLDLSNAKIAFPLSITSSAVPRGMFMQRCHLYALFLTGTHTGPINADGLRVEHDLHMSHGFHAKGEVRLLDATIGGVLSCVNGHFSNPDGNALLADRLVAKGSVFLSDNFKAEGEVGLLGATIHGDLLCSNSHFSNPDEVALFAIGIEVQGAVFLNNGFEAEGEVGLLGATIGRDLICERGRFSNPDRVALRADRIAVKGSVFLSNRFKATGEVRLLGATIGGDLECDKSHFSNPNGDALNADGIDVKGDVLLCDKFKAKGEVRLIGATIGGNLGCGNGQFSNPDGDALSADGIDVKGDVLLCDEFKAKGEVRLLGATIGGHLTCDKGLFSSPKGCALNAPDIDVARSVFLRKKFRAEGGVDFRRATVAGSFEWRGVKNSDQCMLRLEFAKIGTMWDEKKSWPVKLYLDGLVYDRLHSDSPIDSDARLRWLKSQGYDKDKFVPQPYVQLAKVLQEMGHEPDARRILIAKQKDPARLAAMTIPQRVWHHALGLTIGYGYQPWKALLWIVIFIALGAFLFSNVYFNAQLEKTITGEPPAFNTFVYSLDSFVPLIDLHQAKYRLPTGSGLRVYLWLHIAFGWLLTTLLVVGLTGLVRK